MSCLLSYPWPFRSDSAWAASPLCLSLLIPSPCFHHAWPVMKTLCRAGGRTGRLAVVERLLRYCLSKRQQRPLRPGVPSPPLVPALLPPAKWAELLQKIQGLDGPRCGSLCSLPKAGVSLSIPSLSSLPGSLVPT